MFRIAIQYIVPIIFMIVSCDDTVSSTVPPPSNEKRWQAIELFKDADIRYMKKHNDKIYLSAVFRKVNDNVSILFKTNDGVKWDTMKVFDLSIGPIAFKDDTMYVLEDGKIWKYHESIGWELFRKHLLTAQNAYDMFWINYGLFVFENSSDKVFYPDTTITLNHVINIPNISKFVIHKKDGRQLSYTRSYYVNNDAVYSFDGNKFINISQSINSKENRYSNYPALYIYRDTLYAGFNTPNQIKKYNGEIWNNYSDIIPNVSFQTSDNSYTLLNRPTSILFEDSTLFVGTEISGVLEYSQNGWISRSLGLDINITIDSKYDVYTPITQLESIDSKLIVAYGEGFFAPVIGGRGVYTYNLK